MKHGTVVTDYEIEILTIPEELGGGYLARLPQFGELGIVGDGETKEEAVASMKKFKEEVCSNIASGKVGSKRKIQGGVC